MTEHKLFELVVKIEQKTTSDSLTWEKTAEQNEFQTTLANFVVRIREYYDYGDANPNYEIRIIDKDGTTLESISNADLFKTFNQAAGAFGERHPYEIMSAIFKNAKRQALGVDKAIDNILSELG